MLESGQQLQNGRYIIREELGKGGGGQVYLAYDRELEQPVAIKANSRSSDSEKSQFRLTAQMLAKLRHPNLPRVTAHFFDETNKYQYLVMDYIEGEDWAAKTSRKGTLPEEEVLAVLQQIFAALEYLHTWVDPETNETTPIIHRDIKPGNIRQTSTNEVFLVDFGLAKYANQATTIGARGWTRGFAPLEQIEGGTDARTDIYALGATLYKILTGCSPAPIEQLLEGHATLIAPRKLNRAISANTDRVIMKAMHPKPGQRYQTVGEMRVALLDKRHATMLQAFWTSLSTESVPPALGFIILICVLIILKTLFG